MTEEKQSAPIQGIRTETSKTPVSLSRIFTNPEFQKKDTKTVEVRQTVLTNSFYPSAKTETSRNQGLFSIEKFGFVPNKYESKENRVAWIYAPVSVTEEEVLAMLKEDVANGCCIYRELANKPILDEDQEYGISQGLRDMDFYANKQAARYPEGSKDKAGKDISGTLILDKELNPQYRRTFYWKTPKADIDNRYTGDVYMSPEIAVEVAGASVLEGQKL